MIEWWWALVSAAATALVQTFGMGYMLRGWRELVDDAAKNAKDAIEIVTKERERTNDLEVALGIHSTKIDALQRDTDELRAAIKSTPETTARAVVAAIRAAAAGGG